MTTDNFCFYLQNKLNQTSQAGGQWYNDTSPFSIPWPNGQTCLLNPNFLLQNTVSITIHSGSVEEFEKRNEIQKRYWVLSPAQAGLTHTHTHIYVCVCVCVYL